ncbi:ABC transporter permease [Streptomyces hygroscopicus]|uniref:ABC transporter permease n=1 Tax=Streptomyces hygroscopicus TaxID=1912 RepID=UPI00223F7FB2|nr:ABC transporter permease [Streptomyces hygroscopicus]MCW7943469.1 ABC transporter permease [Streptomyces hygroscopicus]
MTGPRPSESPQSPGSGPHRPRWRPGREPTSRRPRFPLGRVSGHFIGAYGLLLLTALLFLVFSLVLPDTFPTLDNVSAILSAQSVAAVLALGATIPIATGRFDLSIGYGLGLAHVMVMHLIVNEGWAWPYACLAVLIGGGVVGVLNGLLVEFARIDSFIATLGTGTVMYGLTGWITGGARIVPGPEGLPPAFTDLYDSKLLGLPAPAYYVLALAVLLWLLLERLPLGRYLYVIGSNPRAAGLVGIPTRRYGIYAFTGSGLVVGFAGVLLAAQQRIGNPSVGMDYLLPAFVGALLGSTTIRPGRANAAGTVVAVTVLAIGLAGVQQLGAEFWVTPLFDGGTLLLAVGIAGYAARRRIESGATAGRQEPAPMTPSPTPDNGPPQTP